MRLRGATKFLLACWAAAVTIGGTGYAFRATADARLAKLVGECEQARRPSPDKSILIRVRENATGGITTISAEAYLRDATKSQATYALAHETAPARRGIPPLVFTRFWVQIPGVGTVEVPSQMTDEHIVTAIRQYFRSLCDPWELHEPAALTGVQRQIVEAQGDAQYWEDWSFLLLLLGGAIGLAGVVFVDRVRELSNASRREGPR